jgi:hypothetical protein
MRIISRRLTWLAALAFGAAASAAHAAPITFEFVFDGQPLGNSAKAVGSITFESSTLANAWSDGSNFVYHVKEPAEILGLDLTVTGASSGNGHFTKASFGFVAWQTNGLLDFTLPLFGQPTQDQPWGTTYDHYSGDFNLFGEADAPGGQSPFHLATYGGHGDVMVLTSMKASSVPEPLSVALVLAGLSVVGVNARRRQA